MGDKVLNNPTNDPPGFRQDLIYDLDGREDILPARLDRWINYAYRFVCKPNVFRHRDLEVTETITLALDTTTYSIATLNARDLWNTHNVTYFYGADTLPTTRSQRVSQVEQREIDDLSTRTTGRPRRYSIWADTLEVDRRPTAGEAGNLLRVRFWERPDKLVLDADNTRIDEEWDEIIQAGAKWRAWAGLGILERAELAKEEFAEMVNDMPVLKRIDAEDPGRTVSFPSTPYLDQRG